MFEGVSDVCFLVLGRFRYDRIGSLGIGCCGKYISKDIIGIFYYEWHYPPSYPS